jgi:hypothetical protein
VGKGQCPTRSDFSVYAANLREVPIDRKCPTYDVTQGFGADADTGRAQRALFVAARLAPGTFQPDCAREELIDPPQIG